MFAPAFQEGGDYLATFALSALAGGQLPVTHHHGNAGIAACGIWTPSSSAPTHSALPDPVLSAPSSFSGDRRGWLFAGLHFHDGPPKSPGGVWAALAAPGYQIISKSPKNKKRSRCESAFGFPLLSFRGYAARWRWALFVLASRFASTPYLAPGCGLCEASPAALPFAPSGRVRREYTTTGLLLRTADRAATVFTQA